MQISCSGSLNEFCLSPSCVCRNIAVVDSNVRTPCYCQNSFINFAGSACYSAKGMNVVRTWTAVTHPAYLNDKGSRSSFNFPQFLCSCNLFYMLLEEISRLCSSMIKIYRIVGVSSKVLVRHLPWRQLVSHRTLLDPVSVDAQFYGTHPLAVVSYR